MGVRGFVHDGEGKGDETDLRACSLKGTEFGAFVGGELCKVLREQVLVFERKVLPAVVVRAGRGRVSEARWDLELELEGDSPAHSRAQCTLSSLASRV